MACVLRAQEVPSASSGDAGSDHIDIKASDVIVKEMEEANCRRSFGEMSFVLMIAPAFFEPVPFLPGIFLPGIFLPAVLHPHDPRSKR